jgi:dTDP-4-dehydrorhamnose 3,5-epimerase
LLYLHSHAHVPSAEAGLNVRDPRLAIEWPLEVTEVSTRDKAHPAIGTDYTGLLQ